MFSCAIDLSNLVEPFCPLTSLRNYFITELLDVNNDLIDLKNAVDEKSNGYVPTEKPETQPSSSLLLTDRSANRNINKLVHNIAQQRKPDKTCYANIKHCSYFISLKNTLNINVNMNSKQTMMHLGAMNTTQTLNDFYHLLFRHNTDNEFEFIYNEIKRCDIKECISIRRRNIRNQLRDNETETEKTSAKIQILDTIHCHYMHCYDIGYKLTKKEKETIIKNTIHAKTENKNDPNPYTLINQEILQKKNILCKKRNHIVDIFGNINLFESNRYNQIKQYEFGHKYYYWESHKNSDKLSLHSQQTIKYWYIAPKYTSLKEELISNDVATISKYAFEIEYDKALSRINSNYAKCIQSPELKTGNAYYDHINASFGIKKGEPLTLNHIIAISVYCKYTILSFEFSQTFRKLQETETDESLKKRHSNLCFLSKYIHEAVHVYSTMAMFSELSTFYHGIQENMLFDSMMVCMNQPCSTTSSFSVALQFSKSLGMILQFKTHGRSKYFDCQWISDFSSEHELLFIGSTHWITFKSVLCQNGNDYTLYVECLSILDTMLTCAYFENDSVRLNEILTKLHGDDCLDFRAFGAKPISGIYRKLTLKIIENELHQYDAAKFCKISWIPTYIEKCFHRICLNKTNVSFNWKAMHMELVDLVTMNNVYTMSGFCGYSFLKDLFCAKEMIDFDFLITLYPNIKVINVLELKSINIRSLDCVLELLHHQVNSRRIQRIALWLEPKSQEKGIQLSEHYISRFDEMEYNITLSSNNLYQKGVLISDRK